MTEIAKKPVEPPAKRGFFARLREKLGRGTGLGLLGLWSGRKVDEALLEELEDRLLLADVGVEATRKIVGELRVRAKKSAIEDGDQLRGALKEILLESLARRAQPLEIADGHRPYLILMIGVNGSGKTTTIGKLAARFKAQGLSVLLAAGDTYRAAAIEQLQTWGQRNDVAVIAQAHGADPAAVVFDAMEAARARKIDVVLADTAGRLQNQEGLMRELAKVVRVAGRVDASAPHEKMLVLDASLGQNALQQAVQFHEAVGLTGITMTKLDGGAKGGILLAIADRLDVPFRFIGIGEGIDDMQPFDAAAFVDALLADTPGEQ